MQLLDFYSKFLADANIKDVDGDGFLSAVYDERVVPITVDKKRLILPTTALLREGLGDSKIAFHPMCENSSLGESDIIKLTKDAIQLRLSQIIASLLDDLARVAASPELHKGMKAAAAEYLKIVPDLDEKTYGAIESILKAVSKNPSRRLVTIYLKRNTKPEDDFIRQAVVSFPIFDEIDQEHADKPEIFGVKMPRKTKDHHLIKALLEYILGDAETRSLYTYGSQNLDAPYFHALATSFYKLGDRLRHLVEKHRKHLTAPDDLLLALDWAPALDNFSLYRGVIPTQRGSDGQRTGKEKETEKRTPIKVEAETFERRTRQEEIDDAPFDGAQPRRDREERREQPAAAGTIGMDAFRAMIDEQTRPRAAWGRQEEKRGGSWATRRGNDDRRDDRDRDRNGRGRGSMGRPRSRDFL